MQNLPFKGARYLKDPNCIVPRRKKPTSQEIYHKLSYLKLKIFPNKKCELFLGVDFLSSFGEFESKKTACL
jgi:hypothetical protein